MTSATASRELTSISVTRTSTARRPTMISPSSPCGRQSTGEVDTPPGERSTIIAGGATTGNKLTDGHFRSILGRIDRWRFAGTFQWYERTHDEGDADRRRLDPGQHPHGRTTAGRA